MTVIVATDGPVAVLTLDYPDHHNALSVQLVGDLLDAIKSVDPRHSRAIVIAGKGRFFCAGANIADLKEGGWLSGKANPRDPVALFEALATHPLPVIAAVGGPALGGGFELCLSCDLVVAADSAWFAAPELGLGVIPNTAAALLPKIVGERRALEITLTRRRVPAAEALALGIVNQVVPLGEVTPAAIGLARSIVEQAPPGALGVLKHSLRGYAPTNWTALRASVGQLPQQEWEEGLGAFLQKRTPDYGRFWDATG